MWTLFALMLLLFASAALLGFAIVAMQKNHHRDRLSTTGPSVHSEDDDPVLHNPLREAINGDEAKLLRLIEYERRTNPSLSELEIELRAYERLRKDRGNN